ncbi:MAG: hypothetical protein IJE73_00055 [Muribaculaceae bacterium]|nr:hypothetical protein [Muribaculaceae bacterium]
MKHKRFAFGMFLIIAFSKLLVNAQVTSENTISFVDSINTLWAGRTFWFNNKILPSKYSSEDNAPTYHYNVTDNVTKFEYKILYGGGCNNAPAPSKYAWPNCCTSFSEGQIGGNTWCFFKAKFVDIKYLPIILGDDYNAFHRRNAISKYGNLLPYIRLVPDSTTIYKSTLTYGAEFYGYEIIDTLFIPYSEKLLNYFMSEQQLADFTTDFYANEQTKWNKHMAKYGNRNKALVKLYGKEIGDIISSGEVRFGFTKEMCSLAYGEEPYKPLYNIKTPLGFADCRNFYTKGIKLYFIDNSLIGIEWKNGKIKFK